MLSRFFIDRPIFAWVVAIVIMLAGALAIRTLPIAQYPEIALPQVSVSANYPGASAKTVEDSVTQVIEQKMKGLDGLDYMSSTSDSSGSATRRASIAATRANRSAGRSPQALPASSRGLRTPGSLDARSFATGSRTRSTSQRRWRKSFSPRRLSSLTLALGTTLAR